MNEFRVALGDLRHTYGRVPMALLDSAYAGCLEVPGGQETFQAKMSEWGARLDNTLLPHLFEAGTARLQRRPVPVVVSDPLVSL